MIRRVQIQGLRGIREGELADLTPLVVIVGPNAAGKSTLLDAVMLGAAADPPKALAQVVGRRELPIPQQAQSGQRWLLWKGGIDGPAKIIIATDAEIMRQTGMSFENGLQFQWQYNASRPDDELWKRAEAANKGGRTIIAFPDISQMRFVDPLAPTQRVPLPQLITRSFEEGLNREAKRIVLDLLPGVEDIVILTDQGQPVVYLTYGDRAVPAAMAGDGVRFLLQISFELATREKGVVLMEEPEVHLHPAGIRQCAMAILAAMRRETQIILTTHSIELIDALVAAMSDAELPSLSLHRVRLDDGLLKTTRLSGVDVATARTSIQDDLR